jgi:hypothetical protein
MKSSPKKEHKKLIGGYSCLNNPNGGIPDGSTDPTSSATTHHHQPHHSHINSSMTTTHLPETGILGEGRSEYIYKTQHFNANKEYKSMNKEDNGEDLDGALDEDEEEDMGRDDSQ